MEELSAMNTPDLDETINAATTNEYLWTCPWLVEKIEHAESIEQLNGPSPRRIYRVPDLLRKLNKEAYTPHVISVGPLHYGLGKLQSMENYKLRYFRDFMRRTEINKDMLESIIDNSEGSVRGCYAEDLPFNSDTMKQIILVDAIFIIEFFLRSWFGDWTDDDNSVLKPWLTSRIHLDLILLENQLPFFIIQNLYEQLSFESSSTYPSSFLDLTLHFFRYHNPQHKRPGDPYLEIMHFVDLLRYFYLPPTERLPKRSAKKVVKEMYCASQLAEAGLKFQPGSGKCFLDLKYNKGVLEIPRFTLDNDTEIYARNIMALEQCDYPAEAYVTDYFIMLDFLINTGKDVDLLVDEKIIVKGRGINIRPTLPSNLCTGISNWNTRRDYYALSRQLVEFRRKHWYVILKSSFKQDYFRTPWMGAATLGAIILLILTLIQTVCTVISILK